MRALQAALVVLWAVMLGSSAQAAVFRWANDGDVNSLDPYARAETFLLSFTANIYEPLVRRDKDLKLEPALATAWRQVTPETWRFTLRQGVKFHDGTPLTADDVEYSYQRAMEPGSNIKSHLATITSVWKMDSYTVDITTKGPDPILPEELSEWGIMSKAWCLANNAHPADLAKNEEGYASRNANGTGPFKLKERVPDVRTVLVANPDWWDKPQGNVTEAVFTRIQNDATRVAALLSGEIDFIYTVPSQDVDRIRQDKRLRLLTTPELRTIVLGMDQARDQLLESNIKGKNPFKDIKVREAFYRAIDENAIKAKVMRGFAQPTALIVGPGINGFDPKLNERADFDPARSRALLAEAGYPDGFEVGLDCPNDRYANDEAICQAVTAMLAKIGVKVSLLAQTKQKWFAKILPPGFKSSFYLFGWTPSTYDAHNALVALAATRDLAGGRGDYNLGGFSYFAIDDAIAAIQSEGDPRIRARRIDDALTFIRDNYLYIPLHQQVVIWAARENVSVTQMADNFFPLRFVTVK